jgi:hypothetical protein
MRNSNTRLAGLASYYIGWILLMTTEMHFGGIIWNKIQADQPQTPLETLVAIIGVLIPVLMCAIATVGTIVTSVQAKQTWSNARSQTRFRPPRDLPQ